MKSLTETAGIRENPAALYLSTLGTTASRRGMISPLNQAATFMNPGLQGHKAWEQGNWTALTAPMIRSIMASSSGCPNTKKKALAAMKGVARSAWELGQLGTEDYQRIRGIKGPRGGGNFAGRHIDVEEINTLIKACSQEETPVARRDTALVWFAHATGARRAELASLRMSHIEQTGNRLKINICGKGKRKRSVYVETEAAVTAFQQWMKLRQYRPDAAVFCRIQKGGEITDAAVSTTALDKILVKRVEQAGLSDIGWHDFRRTIADNLFDSGVDISTVAKIFGHSNVDTTARYDRRGERAKIRAAKLVAAA